MVCERGNQSVLQPLKRTAAFWLDSKNRYNAIYDSPAGSFGQFEAEINFNNLIWGLNITVAW